MSRRSFSLPTANVRDSWLERNFCGGFLLLVFAVAAAVAWAPTRVWAQAPTVSTTQLNVTSGGSTVTSVSSGAVVSLTASVVAGGNAVKTGQVSFCDATALDCLGLHQLAVVQLNASGVAVYRFRPGVGSRRFKAVFVGTNSVGSSASSQSSLTVTAPAASALSTTTTMSRTGSWGDYTLGATVYEIGSTVAPAGTVSFLDTSNGNAVLGSGVLGAGTAATGWLNSTVSMSGLGPIEVAIGDFNEDGIPDVVTNTSEGMTNTDHVAILLGKGDGTFTGPSLTSWTGNPDWILIGDFNQDGHQDLAVQNGANGYVTILLGNGDGTFTTGSTFGINDVITPIVLGDFNGDGKTDLVSAGFNGTDLTIFFGNGDGTFTLGSTVDFPVDPNVLLAADFNGDGKTDLIVSNGQQISVLLGKGDGTFTTGTAIPNPGAASLLAGDFNGDGKLDLAVGVDNQTEGETAPIMIYLGNGDGTFNVVPTSSSVPSPLSLATADFNQDGIPDMVTSNFVDTGVSLLLGRGDGTFSVSSVLAPTGGDVPGNTVVGDLNGDGIPDLVTINPSYSSLSINVTEPTVKASTPTMTILPGAAGAHLVDASYPGSTLYQPSASATDLLWGQPPATVTALTVTVGGNPVSTTPANIVVTLTASVTAGGSPVASGLVNFCDATAASCTDMHLVGTAELTGAGTAVFRFVPGSGTHQYKAVFLESAVGVTSSSAIVDLVVEAPAFVPAPSNTTITSTGYAGNYVLTATVTGVGGTKPVTGAVSFEDTSESNALLATAQLGTSTAGTTWVPSFTVTQANPGFLRFAGGDFNGDGHPDVAVINTNTMSVGIYLGNGDGSYKTAAPLTLTAYTTGVVAGDFNGDGILDVAVSSVGSGIIEPGFLAIYLGHGNGTFTLSSSAPTVGNAAQALAVADINGDGKLDLIINEAQGTRILFGNGDGTFTQGPANGLGTPIAVADLNGDGMPDILVGNEDEYVALYLGNGDGTFTPAPGLPVSIEDPVVSVGDFNGDGIPDLAIGETFETGVAILLGKGDGTFTHAADETASGDSVSAVVGDFNHDGKTDILVSTGTGNTALNLFLGNGDGTFTIGPVNTPISSDASILVQDVNGDGTPDLILDTGNMSVLLTEPTQTAIATATSVAVSGPGTHAVDTVYSGDTNYVGSTSATTPLLAQAAAPTFSVATGTYTSVQTVTMSDTTPGATIYYSLNGPSLVYEGFVPYTGPVSIAFGGTYTLQAYATETGYQQSSAPLATYTLNLPSLPSPTMSPGPGTYVSAQSVTVAETVPGATIYYTLNGGQPTTSSSVYSGPIPVTGSAAIVVLATAPGYTSSESFGTYEIAADALSWPAPNPITYGTALSSAQLDATTPVAGTVTYSPAAGTILTAGTQTLRATFVPTNLQAYPITTDTVQLTVNPATPTITWSTPAAIAYGAALSSAQLDATASVAGRFVYSPAAGTVLQGGTQTLTVSFTPTDTTDFTSATATVSISVSKAVPQISWAAPAAIAYGTALSSAQLNATASVPGSFVYSPAIGTVPAAGTDTLTATFTPTDSVNYATATATVLLSVSQVTPKITWASPAAIAYGTPLGATQLDASASIAGTFLYSPAAGSVLPVGNQTLSATFSPTDATDYTPATASVLVAVINPVPALSALSPTHATAGGSAFSLTVNGAEFVPSSVVMWGSTPLSTQYVSASQLTASVPASAIATAGTAGVTVLTGAPGGGSSGVLQFELDSPATQGAVAPTFNTVTATVTSGSPASYSVTLPSSVIGASVSCLNLPLGASCSYANGVVTITTTANTPPGTYVVTVVFTETLSGVATAFFYLPLLLVPLAMRRKKSGRARGSLVALAALTLLAGGLVFMGCAGGSGGSGGGPTTHQATTSAAVTLVVQ